MLEGQVPALGRPAFGIREWLRVRAALPDRGVRRRPVAGVDGVRACWVRAGPYRRGVDAAGASVARLGWCWACGGRGAAWRTWV